VFDAVTRAAELGMPTEGRRLHAFATGVLDNARLPVSKAEAAINVAAGQARFSKVALRASGADLEVTANVDLAAATLDALLTLTGSPASPGAARPALLVALKGALATPTRRVDTSLLASWLTLRAVEQQSQQIDAMEKVRREAAPLQAGRAAAPWPPALPMNDTSPAALELPPATQRGDPTDPAPPLPPPVDVPAARAPRAESAPPLAPSAPGRAVVRPPGLVGAQN
jgi:hypothetical protein